MMTELTGKHERARRMTENGVNNVMSHKGRKPVRTVKVSVAVRKSPRKGFLGERVSPRVPRVLERPG